jgi:Major Facilitator Superfamily
MWAGTLGSVLGPNLSELGGRLGVRLGIPTLTGPFLFSVVAFSTAAVVGLAWLRPDPLLAARAAHEDAGRPAATSGLRTAVTVVRASRGATTGLVSIATAHAVMVGVMVMTPVRLHGDGTTLRVIGIVISVHIAGMYAASPLMGMLSDRVGRAAAILVGQGLLAASLLVAATSPSHADVQPGVALTLLGLGWSATVVAASTLITESVPGQVRTTVQGLSDLVMGLVAALAGALAGPARACRGRRGCGMIPDRADQRLLAAGRGRVRVRLRPHPDP